MLAITVSATNAGREARAFVEGLTDASDVRGSHGFTRCYDGGGGDYWDRWELRLPADNPVVATLMERGGSAQLGRDAMVDACFGRSGRDGVTVMLDVPADVQHARHETSERVLAALPPARSSPTASTVRCAVHAAVYWALARAWSLDAVAVVESRAAQLVPVLAGIEWPRAEVLVHDQRSSGGAVYRTVMVDVLGTLVEDEGQRTLTVRSGSATLAAILGDGPDVRETSRTWCSYVRVAPVTPERWARFNA